MAWPVEPNWGTVAVLILFGTPPLVSAALLAQMFKNATGTVLEEDEEEAGFAHSA